MTTTLGGPKSRVALRLAWDIGLTNMSDRVDALTGSVEVTSRAGAGTRIRGSVPVLDPVVAA